jgi:hypothetical protein
VAVPKWPLKLTSVGCGNLSGGIQMMTPSDDTNRECCDLRNACLQTCGAKKAYCDKQYLLCSKEVCAKISNDNDGARKKCESSSSIQELLINLDTCQKYDEAQSSHCECVPKAEAAARRERIIRLFYKKFVPPDQIDKVAALAAKVVNEESDSKFVGLLLKLYKKYPQVIQTINDPQQEYMERVMKEARGKDTASGRGSGRDSSSVKDEEEHEESSDAEDLGTMEL